MNHFPKYAAAIAAVVFILLFAFRDAVPPRYAKGVSTLLGVLGGIVPSLLAGETLEAAMNHVIVGGGLGALVGFAAARGPAPVVATLEQLAESPPTRKSPKLPPPLPLFVMALGGVLFGLVVLAGVVSGCTPAERAEAATAARASVPACEAGLTLLADAPELAPLCATVPEIEAAVAELIAEYQASHPGVPAAAEPTKAAKHRRVHAKRTGGHRDGGAP